MRVWCRWSTIADSEVASPTAAYARAIAALIADDDDAARTWAARMRGASPAFDRTAGAIIALAGRDPAAYAEALEAIVRDFERRTDHLTAVAIADTVSCSTARRGSRHHRVGAQLSAPEAPHAPLGASNSHPTRLGSRGTHAHAREAEDRVAGRLPLKRLG